MFVLRTKRCCVLRTQTQTNKDLPKQVLICLVGEGGFGPPKSLTTDLQSAPFGRSGIPPDNPVTIATGYLELVKGVEPPTC